MNAAGYSTLSANDWHFALADFRADYGRRLLRGDKDAVEDMRLLWQWGRQNREAIQQDEELLLARAKKAEATAPTYIKRVREPKDPLPPVQCSLAGCGMTFNPKHKSHTYCSADCRNKARAEMPPRHCLGCGCEIARTHKRCSACEATYRKESQRAYHQEARLKKEKKETPLYCRTCPICSAEFTSISQAATYCSKKCRNRQYDRLHKKQAKCRYCKAGFTPERKDIAYCPTCRASGESKRDACRRYQKADPKRNERDRQYRAKVRKSPTEKPCELCGETITLRVAHQRYCQSCRIAVDRDLRRAYDRKKAEVFKQYRASQQAQATQEALAL